jgi:prophage regulatory protein
MHTPPRLLRLKNVRDLTGLSPATIWRKERAEEFPRRVKIGSTAVAWLESEIVDWIAAQVAARDAS